MPNDTAVPAVAVAGKVSQLSGLEKLIVGVPVLAEAVEDLVAVVPPCTIENARVVGEKANVFGAVTVRVTGKVVFAYPDAVAVTVVL